MRKDGSESYASFLKEMKVYSVFIFSAILLCLSIEAFAVEIPQATHYSLKLKVLPTERKVVATARIDLSNPTGRPQKEIPLLLYRLLEVKAVQDERGRPLKFTQKVQGLADEKDLQANVIRVLLPSPFFTNSTKRITITYAGSIYGYSEVMPYVRDTISEGYSLLRPDTFAYPMVARPAFSSALAAYDALFTYDLDVTVPAGYSAATGGHLTSESRDSEGAKFVYASRVPTRRLDISVAKFKVLRDESEGLALYVLPEDAAGGVRILAELKNVIALYTRLFGPPPHFQGYTVIEIPDGWGSQAGSGYILQASSAFTEPSKINEVYHEVAHAWNVKTRGVVQRCRYFDEAFASYFESLATREFMGERAFLADLERSRELFVQWVKHDHRNYETPIVDYWKEERGRLSYLKGAWSLYVLHQLVGDEIFFRIVRTFVNNFSDTPASFDDFRKTAEAVSGKDLRKLFDDWIFTTESSRLMVETTPLEQILRRYQ